MLKNYDELIDLIHKNDKKIESFLNILTKKLKALEGVLWKDYNLDVDHLNLTLALANRQVYENKLHDSVGKEPREEQKQDTKALDLVNKRIDLVNHELLVPILREELPSYYQRQREINFLMRLKDVLSEVRS